jgi:hypothetical protein
MMYIDDRGFPVSLDDNYLDASNHETFQCVSQLFGLDIYPERAMVGPHDKRTDE